MPWLFVVALLMLPSSVGLAVLGAVLGALHPQLGCPDPWVRLSSPGTPRIWAHCWLGCSATGRMWLPSQRPWLRRVHTAPLGDRHLPWHVLLLFLMRTGPGSPD